ncbi:unnamed protein product [Leuciscus chuanchicus]
MASKKSSKTVAAKEDANSSDSIAQGNVNAILAAIGAQGDDLKKLIEDKMTALSVRLDALDATLVNLQSEQAGIKQKVVEIEGALNGTDLRLGAVEKSLNALREAGLKWSLRFPAKLTLHHNGRECTFESPEEAKKFVDNLSNDSA